MNSGSGSVKKEDIVYGTEKPTGTIVTDYSKTKDGGIWVSSVNGTSPDDTTFIKTTMRKDNYFDPSRHSSDSALLISGISSIILVGAPVAIEVIPEAASAALMPILKGAGISGGINLFFQGIEIASGKKEDLNFNALGLAMLLGAYFGPVTDNAIALIASQIEGSTGKVGSFVLPQLVGRIITSPLTIGSFLFQKAVIDEK